MIILFPTDRVSLGREGAECYTADVLNSGLRNRSSDLPESQIGFVARPHLSTYKISRLAALLQRFIRWTTITEATLCADRLLYVQERHCVQSSTGKPKRKV